MRQGRQSLKPPRGAQALLRSALPGGSTRDAIIGDLHEELLRDATRLGEKQARARYRSRAAGIVAHALWDSLCWRVWAPVPKPARPMPNADPDPMPHDPFRGAGRARRFVRDIGLVTLALVLLSLSIVVNTTVFRAVEGSAHDPGRTAALLVFTLGVVSVVVLMASAVVAAIVICTVPRWRHRGRHHSRARHQPGG